MEDIVTVGVCSYFALFRGRVVGLSFEFGLTAIFLQHLVPLFIYLCKFLVETQTSVCMKIAASLRVQDWWL